MLGRGARQERRGGTGRGSGTPASAGPVLLAKERGCCSWLSNSATDAASRKVSSLVGLAVGVLAQQHEVAGVRHQHQSVQPPVFADLGAFSCEPCIIGNRFDLHHAALGELAPAWAGPSTPA